MGKYKTILQMVGLSMMLYRYDILGLPIYQHRPVSDGAGRRSDPVVHDAPTCGLPGRLV